MDKKIIKLIIFDLDGVLIDSRDYHYMALNDALAEIDNKYIISYDEHISTYDGRSTSDKLRLLSEKKGLPIELYNKIWKLKQEKTYNILNNILKNERIISILSYLKQDGYIIYCASNSIWNTIKIILMRSGYLDYIDFFISNEDVKYHKPNPEIYLKCISRLGILPTQCCIIEDSPIGIEAALSSGAHVLCVKNSEDYTYEKIKLAIKMYEDINNAKLAINKYKGNINIVIPMAGRGSRFSEKGYTFPKPLIEIHGKPMIQLVVENIGIEGQYIFIVQKDHYEKYCLKYMLQLIAPGCKIICIDHITEGAACTVLLANEYIDNNNPLLIANSDQYLEWSPGSFIYEASSEGIDGCISTFENTHPKWSYVNLNDNGLVTEVREKEVISNKATTGLYFWKKGSDFVKYANQMINKNIRVNNEFYVAPVYNEAINDNLKIKISDCKKMWGIGTPEDLELFIEKFK